MTIKTILTTLRGDEMDPRCLAVAGGFAQRFSAHLVALYVEHDPTEVLSAVMFDVGGGAYFTEELVNTLQKENDARRNAAKKYYSEWRVGVGIPEAVAPGEAVNESTELVLKVGTENTICAYALTADLVVTALAEKDKDEGNVALEVALIDAGRPVIALPRKFAAIAEDAPIAVAWNASAESAHALSSALPLMRDASEVLMLHAGAGSSTLDGVTSYLRWHGIAARGEELGDTADPEDLIAKRVSELAPSLLVMGAYTHSRAREFVFGGVTHRMLKATQVPLLLAH